MGNAPGAQSGPVKIAGRYVVEATLGRGGMGVVSRVLDEASGRRLALKQMTSPDRAAALRFRREFHTMRNLAHPRIVEVFDYGVDGGTPYYTLELLDGQDLQDLDKVPWPRACELLRDVASALAFLHARRLLHRDLAPRNVRCTSDGRAKLIDFGVLTTIGISDDVAGTPPFMAPEITNRRPLDQRYDLFGLGALAYRILTGQHAYPARAIAELTEAQRKRPLPPSSITPDLPAALDELVLSLISLDPLARPAGAAEVIDRLSAIAGLSRPPEIETTRGWIASGTLVGREREVAQIKRAATRAFEGEGRTILIEAPSGIGKTRLLAELEVEAQLRGATLIRASVEASDRGPYGVIHALARDLIATIPDDALACARPRAAVLARVIPTLRGRFGVMAARAEGEPNEDRMRVQEELAGWIREIAERRSIALVVDDIQRCDEASAAVLAGLAHRAADRKLLLGLALRTDEPARAPNAIAAIADGSQRLRLHGLDEANLAALCRSLFGDVPNVPRLASWMHRVAGGSPMLVTELARHLVDQGSIRYTDGLWSIPQEPALDDPPESLVEAMDARVRSLPASARTLGEALSIHGGELPLHLIVSLAESSDEATVFASLDTLAYEEVLVQAGTSWRFRHDGLREALLRGLSDDRRRALHRRVGETLLATSAVEGELPGASDRATGARTSAAGTHARAGDQRLGGRGSSSAAERDAEIGWHLLRGGDTPRGAALLERAGRALYAAQSFLDCIPALEAALAHASPKRTSGRLRLELQYMLVMAGMMADRKTAIRHSDECVAGFRYWSGMDVAAKASRLVGKHVGVLLGLCWGFLRWLFSPRRGPNPYAAFRTYFLAVGYSAAVYLVMMDLPKLQGLVDAVRPIAIFKNRVPYAAYLITRNTLEFPRGNVGEVRRNCRRVLEIMERDRLTPISDIDRRTAVGGSRYLLVLAALSSLDPQWEVEVAALAKVKLRFFDVGADQARLTFHRLRGEEEAASELEGRVELAFVQLGSIWQLEAMVAMIASLAYAFARDTLGLRRTIEQLARLCKEGFALETYLQLARGEYFRERGDVQAAITELQKVADTDGLRLLRVPGLPALAEALIAAGEYERAKQVALEGVKVGADPDYGNLLGELRSVRTLAVAEAALGEHESAIGRLEEGISRAFDLDSPLLSGSLHEARARIALATQDAAGYAHHLAETARYFRRTRNPALVVRAERLAAAGRGKVIGPAASVGAAAELAIVTEAVTAPTADPQNRQSAVLSGCRGSAERASLALQLVVDETRAASGYLFLLRSGGLELVAPQWGEEPSNELLAAANRAFVDFEEPLTVAEPARGARPVEPAGWTFAQLYLAREGIPRHVIGGVALIGGALRIAPPSSELLEDIAGALFDAGDFTLPAS